MWTLITSEDCSPQRKRPGWADNPKVRPLREPQFGLALLIGRLKAVPKWGRENLTKPDIASTGAGAVTPEF